LLEQGELEQADAVLAAVHLRSQLAVRYFEEGAGFVVAFLAEAGEALEPVQSLNPPGYDRVGRALGAGTTPALELASERTTTPLVANKLAARVSTARAWSLASRTCLAIDQRCDCLRGYLGR